MVNAKKGKAVRGSDLIDLCFETKALQCAGFVAANAVRKGDGAGVVALAMGTAEGAPAAFVVMDCAHDVELVIDRLRAAAKDAFRGHTCTRCDS